MTIVARRRATKSFNAEGARVMQEHAIPTSGTAAFACLRASLAPSALRRFFSVSHRRMVNFAADVSLIPTPEP